MTFAADTGRDRGEVLAQDHPLRFLNQEATIRATVRGQAPDHDRKDPA